MEIPISSSGSCNPSSLLVFLVNSLLPAKNHLWTWPALDLWQILWFLVCLVVVCYWLYPMQKRSEIPELLVVFPIPTKIAISTHERQGRPDDLWRIYADTLHEPNK